MFPALRVVAVLHALALVMQPVLAGLFLSGQDTAIDAHSTNAMLVGTLCLVQTVLAVLLWRRKALAGPIVANSAVLLVLELVQTIAGLGHIMWLHIPLGAMLIGAIATFMQRVMVRSGAPAAVAPAGAEAAE